MCIGCRVGTVIRSRSERRLWRSLRSLRSLRPRALRPVGPLGSPASFRPGTGRLPRTRSGGPTAVATRPRAARPCVVGCPPARPGAPARPGTPLRTRRAAAPGLGRPRPSAGHTRRAGRTGPIACTPRARPARRTRRTRSTGTTRRRRPNQRFVRRLDLEKARQRRLARRIRVVLLGQRPVRALDFGRVRSARHAEDAMRIGSGRHLRIITSNGFGRPKRRRRNAPCPATCARGARDSRTLESSAPTDHQSAGHGRNTAARCRAPAEIT